MAMISGFGLRLCGAAMAGGALLAGCSSPVRLDQPAPVETRSISGEGSAASGAEGGAGAGARSTITPFDTTQGQAAGADQGLAPGVGHVIYFDFNSFAIKDTYRPIIEANASFLKADHSRHEIAEGNTDERGGAEYNLALGQKRADAVVREMQLLGVPADQLEAVSYGKEHPADPGHDEAAWAKNRRVELRSK